VPKGQRRIGGLDDMIISLYAGGMTLRDIQFHLLSTIGTGACLIDCVRGSA
jgi:transposase-like protein